MSTTAEQIAVIQIDQQQNQDLIAALSSEIAGLNTSIENFNARIDINVVKIADCQQENLVYDDIIAALSEQK